MKKILAVLVIALVLLVAGCQTLPVSNTTKVVPANETNASVLKETNASVDTTKVDTKPKDTAKDEKLPTATFKEGETVQIKDNIAYDPDGDELAYVFSSPLDKNGEWETEIGDAGEYIVTITASDGKLESTQKVKLVIESVNSLPVISKFSDVEVDEGEKVAFNPTVTDADNDSVKLSYSGFMTSDEYQTTYKDAGEYKVTLTADDGKQKATKTVTVTVKDVNRAPVLSGVADVSVTEGDLVKLTPTANDPDGDALSVTYGKPLNSNGSWQTKVGDAGAYSIDVVASDGKLDAKKTVKVTVKAFNRVPTLDVPAKITVDEGETVSINPTVADADGDALKITYAGFMKASSYETKYGDAGSYTTTVSVSDGKETVSKNVSIVIVKVNRAPVFTGDIFE